MKHLTAEELAQYIESLQNRSTGKLPKEIVDHIAECDQCASEVIEFHEIEKDLKIVPSQKIRKIKPLYYASAAVAASLLVFFILNFNTFTSNKLDTQISGNELPKDTVEEIIDSANNTKDSIEEPNIEEKNPENNLIKELIPKKEVLLAENYEPNSNLESLVDRYRGTLRGEEIEVITPIELRLKKGSPVSFKWNTEEAIELTVEVYNNKAKKIEESSTAETKYKCTAIKSQGLYYWKMFNEDFDLIFCGKIVIE